MKQPVHKLPPEATFVTQCAMDDEGLPLGTPLRHDITAVRIEKDGERTVFSGMDANGIAHDVPMLDEVALTYMTDAQALRVAVPYIASQAHAVHPCCC